MSLCPFLLFSSCLDLKKNTAHMLKFKDPEWGTSKVCMNSNLKGKRTLDPQTSAFSLHAMSLGSWFLWFVPPWDPGLRDVSSLHRSGVCPLHPRWGSCGKWSPACVHCKRLVPRAPGLLDRYHRREVAGCLWAFHPRCQWPVLCGNDSCGQERFCASCVLFHPQPHPQWGEELCHLHSRSELCF